MKGMKLSMKLLLSVVLTVSLLLPLTQANAASSFRDVRDSHWAKNAIELMAKRGIVSGYPGNVFRPDAYITREEAAVMLGRAFKSEEKSVSHILSLLLKYDAIDESTITERKGYITRKELAQVLSVSYQMDGTYSKDFKDVPKDHPYYYYISAIADRKVTQGYPDGTFKPDSPITRAQFSVFLAADGNLDKKPFWKSGNTSLVGNKGYIKDPVLEKAIRAEIKKPIGVLTKEDMLKLTALTISSGDITSLSGLELASNLTDLRIEVSYNKIKDLKPLANLRNLNELVIYDLKTTDISPLANLTNLTLLYIYGDQITDISPLANLTNLTHLYLSINHINPIKDIDISFLANFTNLTELWLSGQITDISPLANLTNLTELDLAGNQIKDISPLKNLTNLEQLWLFQNQIKDISPLANLTNLTELLLSKNQIKDISPLKNLTNLEGLVIYENQIKDISALGKLTDLKILSLAKNQIKDISPLKNLTNLDSLAIDKNQITDISVLTKLTKLTDLYISGNPIINTQVLKDIQINRDIRIYE